jgi:hypothetical protein
MKNKVLPSLFILCCAFGYSQTNNKLGINIKGPTESLDVNGTTRLRGLPTNGAINAINTKTDGTASAVKDQTYSAVKTVVVDANGVMGSIHGIAITTAPEIKTIQYVRKSTVIDANINKNSETSLGNLTIRYASNGSSGEGNWIEFKTAVPNQVTAFGQVSGQGGNYFASWKTTAAAADKWEKATNQTVTASHRDTYDVTITFHNSQEIYRVSLICNAKIDASGTPWIAEVPARVIIFIEKLE